MHQPQQQQQPFHHQQAQSPDSPTLVETRTIENFQFNEPFDMMQASSSASPAAAPGRSRASPPADASASDTNSGTVAIVGSLAADGSAAEASATVVDLTTDNLPAVDTPDACDKAAMR